MYWIWLSNPLIFIFLIKHIQGEEQQDKVTQLNSFIEIIYTYVILYMCDVYI